MPKMKPAFVHVGRLPGLNEYTAACRGNRYAGASMKKETEDAIGWSIVEHRTPRHTGQVEIAFTWHEPAAKNGQRRDFDNIVMAKKFLLDAMVAKKVIKDDSLSYIVGIYDRVIPEPNGKPYGVEVYVHDVGGDAWGS